MSYRYDKKIVLTPHYIERVFRSQQVPITMVAQELMKGEQRQSLLSDIARRTFEALYAGIVEFPVFEIEEPSGTIKVPTQLQVATFQEVTQVNLLDPEAEAIGYHEARVNLVSPYQNLPNAHMMLGALSLHDEADENFVTAIHLARDGEAFETVDVNPLAPAPSIEVDQFAVHAHSYLLHL